MIKDRTYRPTQDRMRIFVSSRIDECSAERKFVAEAIRSLNHEPILFEHLGPRPYPPRELYLSKLITSQLMVGIYRHGYGYIDQNGGMEISGLEDEYRFARKNNIDTLCYVYKNRDGRDPRLQNLIDEIGTGGITFSLYDLPAQLYESVRDSVTALFTEWLLTPSNSYGAIEEDAAVILAQTLQSVGVIVQRDGLIRAFKDCHENTPIICIHGPHGIGKTTFSAQLTQTLNAKFVRVSKLAPLDVFNVCLESLSGRKFSGESRLTTIDGARLALASAWAEFSEITLVLDECDFVDEVISALKLGGEICNKKQLIFTSQSSSLDFPNFEIPALDQNEVEQILAGSPWPRSPLVSPAAALTPLELQSSILHSIGISIESIGQAGGTADEILTYLALSPDPLSAEQLIRLRDDEGYSISSLLEDIQKIKAVVDDSPRGYRITHAEISAAIANRIKESPQRHQFFAQRLIRLAKNMGRYGLAYQIAVGLNNGSERKFIRRAIREASRLGDWRLGISLVDQLLTEALDTESKSEALTLMLSLVYPLELLGDLVRAQEILERARPLARELGEEAMQFVLEIEVSSKARNALLISDVECLKGIYQKYGVDGKPWDQARIGIELSALYMAAKDFESAIQILRPSLLAFQEVGDSYGLDLAERNLAAALSAMGGHDSEAEELIARIAGRVGDRPDTRRQRAWLCNILTSRLRKAGRFKEAKDLAIEAIQIAEDLGDESLRSINQVNLGNILRDSKQPFDAISSYQSAVVSSKKCGRLDVEADASRLIAGIYNDFEEVGNPRERREIAKFFAQHAIGLSRDTINTENAAKAFIELGEAYEFLGEIPEAISAFFTAAESYRDIQDTESASWPLNHAINISLPDHIEDYLDGLSHYLRIEPPKKNSQLPQQFISMILPIFELAPKNSIIRLLGQHLGILWSNLPLQFHKGIASVAINKFNEFCHQTRPNDESWRILYSAIAVASLLKDAPQSYLHSKLADSVCTGTEGIFAREEEEGCRTWTLLLDLGVRVTVSISSMDSSPETNLAAIALSTFIKAFEKELGEELLGGKAAINELHISVVSFDHLPEDLRAITTRNMNLDTGEAISPCSVTRPTSFKDNTPTIVILGPTFLQEVAFGNLQGNGLNLLLGLTLVEVTFQLLRGEVEMDVIRPKVVSLIRRALP